MVREFLSIACMGVVPGVGSGRAALRAAAVGRRSVLKRRGAGVFALAQHLGSARHLLNAAAIREPSYLVPNHAWSLRPVAAPVNCPPG
jgi:hypothetical protein